MSLIAEKKNNLQTKHETVDSVCHLVANKIQPFVKPSLTALLILMFNNILLARRTSVYSDLIK